MLSCTWALSEAAFTFTSCVKPRVCRVYDAREDAATFAGWCPQIPPGSFLGGWFLFPPSGPAFPARITPNEFSLHSMGCYQFMLRSNHLCAPQELCRIYLGSCLVFRGQILSPCWGIKSTWHRVKVDSGMGLAMVQVWGVDSGVDIRWVYSQLRHRVPYTMFFFEFCLREY